MTLSEQRRRAQLYGLTLKKSGVSSTPYFLFEGKTVVSDPRGMDYAGIVSELDRLYRGRNPDEADIRDLAKSKGFGAHADKMSDGKVLITLSFSIGDLYGGGAVSIEDARNFLENVDRDALRAMFPVTIFPDEDFYTEDEIAEAVPGYYSE